MPSQFVARRRTAEPKEQTEREQDRSTAARARKLRRVSDESQRKPDQWSKAQRQNRQQRNGMCQPARRVLSGPRASHDQERSEAKRLTGINHQQHGDDFNQLMINCKKGDASGIEGGGCKEADTSAECPSQYQRPCHRRHARAFSRIVRAIADWQAMARCSIHTRPEANSLVWHAVAPAQLQRALDIPPHWRVLTAAA